MEYVETSAAMMASKSDPHKSASQQTTQTAIDPALRKVGYSRILLRYIWRLVCTVTNMAALVLLFRLGGALWLYRPIKGMWLLIPRFSGGLSSLRLVGSG